MLKSLAYVNQFINAIKYAYTYQTKKNLMIQTNKQLK